jgi:hypothetical protein
LNGTLKRPTRIIIAKSKTAAAKDRFAYVSYLYDYVWYGEFELDDTTYDKTRAAFEAAIQSVGHE